MNTETTIMIAKSLWEYAKKEGFIDAAKLWFSEKSTILVLGASGVGKTLLVRSLVDDNPMPISKDDRTGSPNAETVIIESVPFVITDTPGQSLQESIRREEIRKAMKSGVTGIINVVCYGYHEHRTGEELAFADSGEVKQGYLDSHRAIEIEALKEWTELLGNPDTTKWLMTVITKADLWWHRRDDVQKHYQTGDYNGALGAAKALHHVVVENASVLHKFYGRGSLSGQFDDEDRRKFRNIFLRDLVETTGKRSVSGKIHN
jgi:hypothetical protein